MALEQIERETTIAAPIERVWALLTEAEHVGGWAGMFEQLSEYADRVAA